MSRKTKNYAKQFAVVISIVRLELNKQFPSLDSGGINSRYILLFYAINKMNRNQLECLNEREEKSGMSCTYFDRQLICKEFSSELLYFVFYVWIRVEKRINHLCMTTVGYLDKIGWFCSLFVWKPWWCSYECACSWCF